MTTTTDMPTQPAPETPKKSGVLRFIKWMILVIVLIVIITVAIVMMKLNEIVRRTVETQSTAALNVPAKLDGASVSLLGGSVRLNGFDLGSPQGFKSPQMMQLGEIGVNVSVGELRSTPMRVSTIDIKNPKMVIEMSGTDFNIKKFSDGIPPTDPNKETIKLIIGSLNVEGAQVILRPDVAAMSAIPGIGKSLGGLKQEYVLNIPTLNMKDVGTGEGNQNGAAIKDVVSLLVTQLAAKAAESDDLPPELKQLLSLNVNDIAGSLKAKLGEAANQQIQKIGGDLSKKMPGETGKVLENVLKDPKAATSNPSAIIEQGLGGLLAPKKPKSPSTQPAK